MQLREKYVRLSKTLAWPLFWEKSARKETKGDNKIMNKSELINAVAEKAALSKKDAEAAVTAALDVITAALADGEEIRLVGFGTFEVKKREARMGRNPKTKEPIPIAASKVPAFKPGKALKDAVAQ